MTTVSATRNPTGAGSAALRLVVLLASTLLVAGCGTGSGEDDTADTDPKLPATPVPAASASS